MKTTYILLMVGLLGCVSCKARNPQIESASVKLSVVEESDSAVITGDARTELYYPLLQGKRVAVFGNHTALLPSGEHLVDNSHLSMAFVGQQTQVSMCLVLLMLRQVFLSFHFMMEVTTVLLRRP